MGTAKRQRSPPAPQYDFEQLARNSSELRQFMRPSGNDDARLILDFSIPGAKLALARAILQQHFSLTISLPDGHLVPTVPARVQYVLWAKSLAEVGNQSATMLDVGTGPSAIYALLGARLFEEQEWKFLATETDRLSARFAQQNITQNGLSERITVLQRSCHDSLIPESELFANAPLRVVVCNPPFYDQGQTPAVRPRPGTESQTETHGGEVAFVSQLANDSCRKPGVWFTSLVGIKSDLPRLIKVLRSRPIQAPRVVTVEFAAGTRTRRWGIGWYFGSSTCSVTVSAHDLNQSALRRILEVRLGGRHAGKLCARDLLKYICECLQMGGWVIVSSDAERSAICASDDDGGNLQCVVSNENSVGSFRIVLKCVSRGKGLTQHGLENVATRLQKDLKALLDK